jgi:protoporphyrinogen oxidase
VAKRDQEISSQSAMKQDEVDVVVFGAGVAGLSLAWKLSEAGKKVLVLEKNDEVGGLHRTFWRSGFGFDFSAHRFHSANKKVKSEIIKLMGTEFIRKNKKSRIYLFDRFLQYPFDLAEVMRAMTKKQVLKSVFDFFKARIKYKISKGRVRANTYKDWFVGYFGEGLYQVMCEPYTRKFWKISPAKISADWADQRFKTVKIRELVSLIVKKALFFRFSSGKLDEQLYPDSGEFYYAKTGASRIPERMKEETLNNEGKVLTGIEIIKTRRKGKKRLVWFRNKKGNEKSVLCKLVVTTIPLQQSVELITARVPREIRTAMEKMRYMDIIFANIIVRKKNISADSWLYFADENTIFNRLVEFKNWSKKMVSDQDKTGACFDISVFENSLEKQLSDEEIIDRVVADSVKLKLFEKNKVEDAFVVRVPYAYPVYDLGYRGRLEKIVRFVEKDKTVFCLGRTGLARYNNADGSIEMGFELADRIIKEKNISLLDYSFKGVSL